MHIKFTSNALFTWDIYSSITVAREKENMNLLTSKFLLRALCNI
jgi:hypothetical protein